MPSIDFTRRTALYRLFDKEGRLLYVGVAFDPDERWKDHATFKPWWPLAINKVVEWHASRTLALQAEADAIRTEKPLHNIKGSDLPRGRQGAASPPCQTKPKAPRVETYIPVSDHDWEVYADRCWDKGISRPTDLRLYIKAQVAAHKRLLDKKAAQNVANADS